MKRIEQTTTMKSTRIQILLAATMAAAISALNATALAQPVSDVQSVPPPAAEPQRSAADLEKLAAPMALYPDPLVAVMLPAAAYPLEIVQAARFVANTNNLATLDDQPWDDNVKAVARFPSVIQNMSDELNWTVELGQAFVQQPSELMDAVQSLRAKAQSVGTLQTTPQQVVIVTNAVVERMYETQIVYVTNTVVQIVPASPQLIYVPVYNPVVVYAPPPTYVYSPVSPLIVFGAGIACGVIIANHHCDWYYGGVYYGRRTTVVVVGGGRHSYYPPPPYYRPPPYYPPPGYRPPPPGYRPPGYPPPSYHPGRPTPYSANGGAASAAQRWQPDQKRMVANGGAGSLPSASTMEARGWTSGANAAATRPANGAGANVNRPSPGTGAVNTGNRPVTVAQQPARNVSTPTQPRSANNPPVNRPAPSNNGQGSAFDGIGNGAAARDASNRGAASRGSGHNLGGGNVRGGRR